MLIRIIFIIVLVLANGQPAWAQKISRDGDLTAAAFDELGFDTTGLVGYWQLNGNAVDSSIYGNNGTILGASATTDRFGTANKAMYFNGTSYIETNNLSTLPFGSSARTVSFWAKADSIPGSDLMTMVGYGIDSAGPARLFMICIHANGPGFLFLWGNAVNYTSTHIMPVGSWVNISVVLKNNNIKFYLNGVGDAGGSITLNTVSPSPVMMGFGKNYNKFEGTLDEVKIFNRDLSAAEIVAMYDHEKGKFSIDNDGTNRALSFVEDPALPVQMRSKKESLTVQGTLIEE